MTDTSTITKTRDNRSIYVDDLDGMKFYEMVGHDAMTLTNGDLLVYRERLVQVKDVRKKHVRGGIDWTITLDNGFQFDPTNDFVSGISDNMRSIRYWRPRSGF